MKQKEQAAHNQQSLKDASDDKLIKELWKEIRKLPRNCRKVVVLFCFDNCTPEEISELLGMPVNTVLRRLQISREHLSIDLDSAAEQLRNLSVPENFIHRVMESIRDISPMPKGNTRQIHF